MIETGDPSRYFGRTQHNLDEATENNVDMS